MFVLVHFVLIFVFLNTFELTCFVTLRLSFISVVMSFFSPLGSVLLSMPRVFQSKLVVLDATEQLSCMSPEAKAV